MGDYIIPGAQAVTEWYSRIHGVMAGCGEASLAVIEAINSGNPPTVAQVTQLILQAIANGWSNPYGVITPSGLAKLGAATGNPLTIGSGSQTLQTVDANLAKGIPTEIGVSKAWAFGGNDRTVWGHYVTVVGKNTDTGQYIVADPFQPAAVNGGFMRYSAQQIMNAAPFATLTPQNAPNPGGGGGGGGVGGLLSGFNPIQQFLDAFHTNATDFAWRLGLIVGGMVLIVWGMVIFFSHQEVEAANDFGNQVSGAAQAVTKVAATGGG